MVPDDKKIVAIVAPHTSWHDFFVGVFTRSVLKMENRIKFLGKYELFKNPLIGWFLRNKWDGCAIYCTFSYRAFHCIWKYYLFY